MGRLTSITLSVVLLLGAVTAAPAAVVQFNFTGVVVNTGAPFDGGLNTTFSGSFSYDDTVTTIGMGPFGGTFGAAYQALTFQIDSTPIASPIVTILNNSGGTDGFIVSTTNGQTFLEAYGPSSLWSDKTLSNLNGRTLANFTAFSGNQNNVENRNSGMVVLSAGILRSLGDAATAATPEPASIATWGVLGTAGFLFRRRRAK